MTRNLWHVALVSLLVLMLVGCGSGDDDNNSTPTVTRAPLTLRVDWAARTRAVTGPASALSVVATVVGGTSDTENAVVRADRNTDPAAYQQTLTVPDVRTGQRQLQITFYAQANGQGDVVATASQQVTINEGATNDAGTVTLNSRVASVEIPTGQTVRVAETKDLTVTVRDAQNTTVAVSPGSITYAVTQGNDFISVNNGQIRGNQIGTANVTATVDGITSQAATVQAVPASLTIAPNQTVEAGQTKNLTVTATDANNAPLDVPAAALTYTVTEGGTNLQAATGGVQGVLAGTATVTTTLGITSAPVSVAVLPKVNSLAAQESGLLIGLVRVRVRGIASAQTPVAVSVGQQAATEVTIAYPDSGAPADSTTQGGAIDFRVPSGLTTGAQNLTVTVNGQSNTFAITVPTANPFAIFTLQGGNKFAAELRSDKAPNTVNNFVGLATGTRQWTPTFGNQAVGAARNTPLYNGVIFHRVTDISGPGDDAIKIIQVGDPITAITPAPAGWTAGTGGPGFTIPFEVNDLTHVDGAISMARAAAFDTAGSQIFICDGPHPFLNTQTNAGQPVGNSFVVFGQVVENLPNAKAITQGTVLQSVTISGRIALP